MGSIFIFLILVLGLSFVNGDDRCQQAVYALQKWYNTTTGVWVTTGWWNSANALNGMIDYFERSGDTTYYSDISVTYNKAIPPGQSKTQSFLNDYYDDEGWWALAWINAYDFTRDNTYLNMAKSIFDNMAGAWDTTCGGGIWWDKAHTYKNAIANELFLAVAARLHLRSSNDSTYLNWATKEWAWFNGVGLINSNNLINDGLDSNCKNNGETTWTYNQGVILGGLVDLAKAVGNNSLVGVAQNIASSAINTLSKNGILVEPCEPGCGTDGPQFKGIFMRNLYYLNHTNGDPKNTYDSFLRNNGDSIWNKDRNGSNQLGLVWSGPFDSADASRQSSALDALNSVCF